ncbi:MAG: glycosyltransferase [Cytophagales bacterium]
MSLLTVVISYYKATDNLFLILQALNNQSCMDFEVIVSEDDNCTYSKEFIENISKDLNFTIIHISQEIDNGFRKNEMLNKSILKASADKLAFIDGDCVPNEYFVENYINEIDEKSLCVGRAVFLDEKTTETLKELKSISKLNFFNLLFTKTTHLKDAIYFPLFPLSFKVKGLVGRNWGCHKKSLMAINGFDEDYVQAGVGEDVDVEWRLLKLGIERKSMKNKSVVYHLYHDRWYTSENEQHNYNLMEDKILLNNYYCLNGIQKV